MVNIGQRFGNFVVKSPFIYSDKKHKKFVCICDCGEEKVVREDHIKAGFSKSCGCLRKKILSKLHTKHGQRVGGRRTIYAILFDNIVERCENKNCKSYKNYGGRGISISDEFRDSKTFIKYILETLGPRPENHSIDRINPNGNYERGNLRWATAKEQQWNKIKR